MTDPWWLRVVRSVAATAILSIALFVVAIIYTSSGGSARELLVKELLVNLMLVLGLQVFMGNTGILSFGHIAFAQIAAYAVAICVIPVATKAQQLPDLPFGLGDVHLGPLGATLVGVLAALALGTFVGIAVARTGGLPAAMITLAVLFVVDQGVKNWQELTKGAGGLSGVPILTGTTWLWLATALAMLIAHWFGETRAGRFAVATREDEIAAPSLGIGMFGARLGAWTVSIAVMGLAGSLRVQTIGSTNPRQYTLDAAVLVLAMLVVGGMRTVTGAVVGTVIVTVGNETFRQLGDPQRLDIERFPDLFLGATLLLVMLVRPEGLLGDTDLAGWLRRVTLRSRPMPERAAPERSAALVAEGVEVRFGGFTALDGAGLRVQPGEVVGLIGPNGAGKTTLFNVVTGLVESQSGVVRLGDHDLTGGHPHEVARAGLARTFQNLRLFANLSVRENVAIAALAAGRYRRGEPPVDVDGLIAAAGLTEWANRQARTLDYGNQRRLELARAAALSPEFLLLDEPTSGMSDDESAAMVAQVRTTAASVGAGVLVIDHDLAFITRISDHVVVLAEGVVIAEGTPDEIRRSPAVATAYLGTHA
jgi:branched-chain amino acid transport system permease protein